MIERATIEDMFDHIRNNEDAPFDLDSECLWSYFFTDTDQEKLLAACTPLESEGFTVIGFLEPDPEAEGDPVYFLRIDRIEMHTVDSLMELNQWFYALASEYNLLSYDGMEVGSAESGVGS